MDFTAAEIASLLAPSHARARGTTSSAAAVVPTSSVRLHGPSVELLGVVDRSPLAVAVRDGDAAVVVRFHPGGATEVSVLDRPVGLSPADESVRAAYLESLRAARAAAPPDVVALVVRGCFGDGVSLYRRESTLGFFPRWVEVRDGAAALRVTSLLSARSA